MSHTNALSSIASSASSAATHGSVGEFIDRVSDNMDVFVAGAVTAAVGTLVGYGLYKAFSDDKAADEDDVDVKVVAGTGTIVDVHTSTTTAAAPAAKVETPVAEGAANAANQQQ